MPKDTVLNWFSVNVDTTVLLETTLNYRSDSLAVNDKEMRGGMRLEYYGSLSTVNTTFGHLPTHVRSRESAKKIQRITELSSVSTDVRLMKSDTTLNEE